MADVKENKAKKQERIGYPELISLIGENADISSDQAKLVVNAVKSTFANLLQEGKSISLPDFGKFEVSEVKERQGFNPRTKERIVIAARKMVNLFIPVRYSIFMITKTQYLHVFSVLHCTQSN